MKKLILIFIVTIVFNNNTNAQFVVHDPGNSVTLIQGLTNALKQTVELKKQWDMMKEAADQIAKVNNAIKQIKQVEQIISNNTKLINKVNNNINNILNSPHIRPDEVTKVTASFSQLIDISLENIAFLNKIITSDLFNMNDAERMAVLEEKKKSGDELNNDLDLQIKRYERVISYREMKDAVNNREVKQ